MPWQQRVFELEHSEVFAIKDEVEDKQLQYPDYYTRAFHGVHATRCCGAALQPRCAAAIPAARCKIGKPMKCAHPHSAHPANAVPSCAGYKEGNLSWLAALEAEPATDVMALLPWAKNEAELTGPAAQVGRFVLCDMTCVPETPPSVRMARASACTPIHRLLPGPGWHGTQVRLRSSTLLAIRRFAAEYNVKEPKNILDAGCSGERRSGGWV